MARRSNSDNIFAKSLLNHYANFMNWDLGWAGHECSSVASGLDYLGPCGWMQRGAVTRRFTAKDPHTPCMSQRITLLFLHIGCAMSVTRSTNTMSTSGEMVILHR